MQLELGSKVWLRGLEGCGQPGVIIKAERGRFTVYWRDMDYWSHRLHPASLVLAEDGIPTQQQPESEAKSHE